MTDSFVSWIKRQSEVATSLGILAGGAGAIIVFFGGSIPPWYTPAEAQAQAETAAQIQKDTVQTLGKLNDKIDRVARRLDQNDCAILNATLAKANAAIARSPSDQVALALRDSTLAQMRMIDGCGQY